MRLEDRFVETQPARWCVTETEYARVQRAGGRLDLRVFPTPPTTYSNAQITDYDYGSFRFVWKPPLRMTVTAQASAPGDELRGTAGFGFWNHPFSPDVRRPLTRPQAAWFFFSSPPSDMRLAQGVPGPGWKAATVDAGRWQFLALLPFAPAGMLLLRFPALYRRLWYIGQRAIGVSEKLLDGKLLAEKHTYMLDWGRSGVIFAVDGVVVHEATCAPRGPLGFIAWIDNQYAIVTPQGRFGAGLVGVEREQALVLEQVVIEQT
jgi:hypothetical protein